MIGCKIIGNATLICMDNEPVLVTDPWLGGPAYFGSWKLSYEIPETELNEIKKAQYIWFSHGHPDHLNSEDLAEFKSKQILLPNHAGKRIYHDLQAQGFKVSILPDKQWVTLSKHIKAYCISDYLQDAILLVDINGKLFINLNDAADRGWGKQLRQIIRTYKDSYLLKLSGYGDAEMINFYTEDGQKIIPKAAKKKPGWQHAVLLCRALRCQVCDTI